MESTIDASDVTPQEILPSGRRAITAGIIGNVLEWYDFGIYGFFAAIIAAQYFPSENASVSLIAAFGAFAAGFLMRPLGAAFFGYIGDRVGRVRARCFKQGNYRWRKLSETIAQIFYG